jgi:hypothetical protein
MRFLAPAERHEWFDLFSSHNIALRWSAKTLVGREVYKDLAPLEPKQCLQPERSFA